MDIRNILVLTPRFDKDLPHADETCLAMMRQAAPGASIMDGSELLAAELRGDMNAAAKLDPLLAEAEVIFGFMPPAELQRRAPKLRWFQATSAGVDRLAEHEIWQSRVTITGVSGIHATAISEFALGMMMLLAKGAARAFQNQQRHAWERYAATLLHGKTLGIVGLGNIGREAARLAKAFGMRVVATRRSATKAGHGRNVDLLLPHRDLIRLLGESDYVLLAIPLTPETRHLIGEGELAAMKSTAYLINIARGGVIDQTALVNALWEKRIAGAGLDVTEPEPLPPDSPLWEMDNIILTPHVSGGMDDYMERATAVFCENLSRLAAGKKLHNVVKRSRGY